MIDIVDEIRQIGRRFERVEKLLAAVRTIVTDGEQRHMPWHDLDRHKMAQVQRVYECFVEHCHDKGFNFNKAIKMAFVPDPLGYTKRSSFSSWCYRNRVESYA